MKKKNFLFAGIAILACSVFVSSCSKDEDYAGVDYYEDWTPEQFETFASKSVSIQGEDNGNNQETVTIDTELFEGYIHFNAFNIWGQACVATEFLAFNLNLSRTTIDEKNALYSYEAYVDVLGKSSPSVSISVESVSLDTPHKKVHVTLKYTYSYIKNDNLCSSDENGLFDMDI